MPTDFGRLMRTVRHLRPIQITNRIWRGLVRSGLPPADPPPLRSTATGWVESLRRPASLISVERIELIGVAADISSPDIWRDMAMPKLWLYQLHYFDDLNAVGAASRRAWHRVIMDRWIAENPLGSVVAWDPYPISLRVVNWIKWQVSGAGELTVRDLASLAQQVRYLLARLEHHLLGNHLLENYKTLLIAGCFFSGAEAEGWRDRGLRGLRAQLEDQILPGGAHNELAPMYQAIIAEGMLDAVNFLRCFGFKPPAWLVDTACRMVGWGVSIAQPDGDWPQFNDTALGAAARPGELVAYLSRLGLEARVPDGELPVAFARVAFGDWTLVADVGGLGPDHNPGHGHADNLTYELSIAGRRVVVDTGVSTYEVNAIRARERSTAAHNTVEIDGLDSSEVWGSFRVGRRAYSRRLNVGDPAASLVAEHDGYRHLPGGPIHQREWRWSGRRLEIHDLIRTRGSHHIVAHVHLHPDYNPALCADGSCAVLDQEGQIIVRISAEGWDRVSLSDYEYAPAFGRRIPAKCIELSASCSADKRMSHAIEGVEDNA